MVLSLTQHMSRLTVSSKQSLKSFEGFKAVGPHKVAPMAQAKQVVFQRRAPLKIQAARVGGVEVPNNKYIEYSLQYIFGIGHTTAKAILRDTGIDNKRTRELGEDELTKLREEVDKYTTEGDLRRFNALNIKRLKEIGCYRGRRHINSLPVRGQRTKNNARTRKGKAKAITGKKIARK